MDANEILPDASKYDEEALKYLNPLKPNQLSKRVADATHGALGISSEVGELSDVIKKAFVNNMELDKKEIIKELGDVLWYCALVARSVDSNLHEAMAVNLEKIHARYGDKGYSEIRYNRENRDLKKEDQVADQVITESTQVKDQVVQRMIAEKRGLVK